MTRLSGKIICLFFSGTFMASIPVDRTFAHTETGIGKIRDEVKAINEGEVIYEITIKDVQDISLEGTEATYYRLAGTLKKIVTKMFGETYNATGEFYYNDGELIFAFIKNNHYDVQIGVKSPLKVGRTEEQRFYFADGELVRLLVGKEELESDDDRYAGLNRTVVDIAAKLQDAERN